MSWNVLLNRNRPKNKEQNKRESMNKLNAFIFETDKWRRYKQNICKFLERTSLFKIRCSVFYVQNKNKHTNKFYKMLMNKIKDTSQLGNV